MLDARSRSRSLRREAALPGRSLRPDLPLPPDGASESSEACFFPPDTEAESPVPRRSGTVFVRCGRPDVDSSWDACVGGGRGSCWKRARDRVIFSRTSFANRSRATSTSSFGKSSNGIKCVSIWVCACWQSSSVKRASSGSNTGVADPSTWARAAFMAHM